ncbi:unnamed protein product [Fraxinus pennsylvanica]|uniref:Uncharacterized protein n=1 Tax=Fraxinus pennsylvanica TaxID=56036 RepID=A0AAD2E881_9LAMI|nr:unnamed protein product [Fraxinus pennsylvanica]
MLLRSSSTPIHSLIPHSREPSSEPDFIHQTLKSRCSTIFLSSSNSIASLDESIKKLSRTHSKTDLEDLKIPSKPTKKCTCNMHHLLSTIVVEEEVGPTGGAFFLSSNSGLDLVEDIVAAGGGSIHGGGSGGTPGGGGGGGGNGDDGSSQYWNSNFGSGSMDLYYQNMITANPENPIFLSNYARFLKEVRGDFVKAEEYYGRAILANPGDGTQDSNIRLKIWLKYEDSERADILFNQAVEAAPDDSYVMASYARFLWDAEDEDMSDVSTHSNFLQETPIAACY